jgi:hypothetical protein
MGIQNCQTRECSPRFQYKKDQSRPDFGHPQWSELSKWLNSLHPLYSHYSDPAEPCHHAPCRSWVHATQRLRKRKATFAGQDMAGLSHGISHGFSANDASTKCEVKLLHIKTSCQATIRTGKDTCRRRYIYRERERHRYINFVYYTTLNKTHTQNNIEYDIMIYFTTFI